MELREVVQPSFCLWCKVATERDAGRVKFNKTTGRFAMGWIADLLKEIPSAARYKSELERIAAEHTELKQENSALKGALERANSELAALRSGAAENLGPEKEKILRLLSERDRLHPQVIASACGMGIELVNLHLEELFDTEHITNVLVMGEGAYYSLDQNGRRYLAAKGLLK